MTYREWMEWKQSSAAEAALTGNEINTGNGLNSERVSDIMSTASERLQSEGSGYYPAAYDGDFDDLAELSLNNHEVEVLETLRRKAIETGHEYGAVIAQGFESRAFTTGQAGAVQIPPEYLDLPNLQLYHSHTNASALSGTDFEWLIRGNVKSVSVEAVNGDVFTAYIGDGYRPTIEEYRRDLAAIRTQANIYVMEYPGFDEWTPEQRTLMAIREQAVLLTRRYGWTLEGGRP